MGEKKFLLGNDVSVGACTGNIDRTEIYKVDLCLANKNDVRTIAYDYIVENSQVLDVGCACGDFGKLIKDKNCKVYGMEYDAESSAIASSNQAYQAIHQINLNEFTEKEYEKYLQYFDSIALLDILEHLLNPEQTLASLTKLLKEDGSLIVSLPNVSFCDIKLGLLNDEFTYTDTGILDRTHIKFYTHKSIEKMMTSLNLEIHECKAKVELISQDRGEVPASIIRYIKKDPHSFVYQYVLKVKLSGKSKSELETINSQMTNLEWSSLLPELKKLKKQRRLQVIFPNGSLRHKIAKKLKNFLINRQ